MITNHWQQINIDIIFYESPFTLVFIITLFDLCQCAKKAESTATCISRPGFIERFQRKLWFHFMVTEAEAEAWVHNKLHHIISSNKIIDKNQHNVIIAYFFLIILQCLFVVYSHPDVTTFFDCVVLFIHFLMLIQDHVM